MARDDVCKKSSNVISNDVGNNISTIILDVYSECFQVHMVRQGLGSQEMAPHRKIEGDKRKSKDKKDVHMTNFPFPEGTGGKLMSISRSSRSKSCSSSAERNSRVLTRHPTQKAQKPKREKAYQQNPCAVELSSPLARQF